MARLDVTFCDNVAHRADGETFDLDATIVGILEPLDSIGRKHRIEKGRRIGGWPVTVLPRGCRVADNGTLHDVRGSGEFLRCRRPETARLLGRRVPEMDPAMNFGAAL